MPARYSRTEMLDVSLDLDYGAPSGQTQVPSVLGDLIELRAGGFHTCALEGDGSVSCWGSNNLGQSTVPSDLGSVRTLSAVTLIASEEDGELRCWGANHFGQIDVPLDLGSVVGVSAGVAHTCAVERRGALRCWGRDY